VRRRSALLLTAAPSWPVIGAQAACGSPESGHYVQPQAGLRGSLQHCAGSHALGCTNRRSADIPSARLQRNHPLNRCQVRVPQRYDPANLQASLPLGIRDTRAGCHELKRCSELANCAYFELTCASERGATKWPLWNGMPAGVSQHNFTGWRQGLELRKHSAVPQFESSRDRNLERCSWCPSQAQDPTIACTYACAHMHALRAVISSRWWLRLSRQLQRRRTLKLGAHDELSWMRA